MSIVRWYRFLLATTYARDFFNANMDTFSIVFSDKKYSEEEFINYVTNHTNSDSHRYQYSSQYVFENFFNATWHLDQPISIPNTFGIKRLAERAKENVTVLLSVKVLMSCLVAILGIMIYHVVSI